MRLMMVGSLSKDDVRDLKGQCCIVIAGDPDEIRNAAAFMYQEVEISLSLKTAPEPCPAKEEP